MREGGWPREKEQDESRLAEWENMRGNGWKSKGI